MVRLRSVDFKILALDGTLGRFLVEPRLRRRRTPGPCAVTVCYQLIKNSRNQRSPDIARTLRVFIKALGHQRTFHKPANHPEPKGNYSESDWLGPPSKLFQFNYFRAG
ncbi:predicted protein [Coccidioides posadasii str. Silveira]|uniref:Predicted protein n=2 Tax=Coccidioides posadasii TaxID=199306 RepID=E9CVV3_COCPS|nr:predicted protein [Coccidioides posadasii str. Silveira]KMM64905.1 hypothetical protein CPAG_01257 [Coccidioides posadasii RMSCC 3488]